MRRLMQVYFVSLFTCFAVSIGIFTTFAAFSAFLTTAHAETTAQQPPVVVPDYATERVLFSQTEALLQQNKIQQFHKQRSQLDQYPLAPYLDYAYLTQHLPKQSNKTIRAFIQQYPDSPLANRLNRAWLKHLARNKQWQRYRQHYSAFPIASTHYVCQHTQALLKGNKKQRKQALSQAKDLWMVGKSQPKTCDPLFKAWMKTGHPTSKEAISRFWLSVENNQIKLARYLEKKVSSKAHKAQIKAFWSIYNQPAAITRKGLKPIPKNHRAYVINMAYKRWFKQKPLAAVNSWLKYRHSFLSKRDQQHPATEYMGIRLNARYHKDALTLSAKLDPDYKLAELTERRIRTALTKQNWKQVHQGITHLPATEQEKPKWQYWLIVSDIHLNPAADHKMRLAELANDRSYYGFLAAELNNSDFKLNAIDAQPAQTVLAVLEAKPSVLRARELFRLGRLTDANREWNAALSRMDEAEKQTAGYLAKSWGWHLQAIINAAKTKRWDHVALRFPHPHAEIFLTHARKNNLDLSFPVAIARQESAFLFNAQSRVGARGLMQLMPRTATSTAKKHNVPFKKQTELFNPETNITLGSAYLGDMLKRFERNPAYASAAYNAGPHRVKRWLKDRGHLPLDVWIETIPFKETRNYVQSVLAYRVIYDRLEGRETSLLSPMQIKQLALLKNAKIAL